MSESTNSLTKVELEKQLNQKMNEVVMFVNFSSEDFECSWDGAVENFPSGQATYLPYFKFLRYQKHLVDREMNKAKIPTDNHLRKDFEAKCSTPVVKEEVLAVTKAAQAEAVRIEKSADPEAEIAAAKGEVAKRKPGRPKKVMEEDSFEGLKTN